jgi:hypothetical protein
VSLPGAPVHSLSTPQLMWLNPNRVSSRRLTRRST